MCKCNVQLQLLWLVNDHHLPFFTRTILRDDFTE
jgi:hypothetical protein